MIRMSSLDGIDGFMHTSHSIGKSSEGRTPLISFRRSFCSQRSQYASPPVYKKGDPSKVELEPRFAGAFCWADRCGLRDFALHPEAVAQHQCATPGELLAQESRDHVSSHGVAVNNDGINQDDRALVQQKSSNQRQQAPESVPAPAAAAQPGPLAGEQSNRHGPRTHHHRPGD